MRNADVIGQGIVARDKYSYLSHPHATISKNNEVVVVFNRSFRRQAIFHPPHDPEYRNLVTRSADMGRSWTPAQVAPGFASSGTECAGLTTLKSGRILLNQWQNHWYPLGMAEAGVDKDVYWPKDFVSELVQSAELETGEQIAVCPEKFAPWARGHGRSFVHISDDGGRSFIATSEIDTAPFHGGYGLRGCVEMAGGALLLPLNDIPEFRTIFVVQSFDAGETWCQPTLVARQNGHLFTEPDIVEVGDGCLLCMMRDDATRILHSVGSRDGGITWDVPEPTGIDGYPPQLLTLSDNRLLCTYGVRKPEFSIRAVLSEDRGGTWLTAEPILIRRHLPNSDLGYPTTILLPDESLMTFYYCQDELGVTGVEFTRWRAP